MEAFRSACLTPTLTLTLTPTLTLTLTLTVTLTQPYPKPKPKPNQLLEIARRTVWAVFRIEWELVHKGLGHARAAASEADDLDAEELQPLGEAHSKHLDD